MAYEPEVTLANYSLVWVNNPDAANCDGFISFTDAEGEQNQGTNPAATVRTETEIYVRIYVSGNEETLAGDYADVAAAKAAALAKLQALGMVAP